MAVKNPANALGEAIGKLIEDELENILKPICKQYNCYYDRGGKRPGDRNGVQLIMVNNSGNRYNLDGVIENKNKQPIVLLESKYLRYKKHNRDKASWTCASHYSLRKTHPTICKSIAVLSGKRSEPSKAFMESFGIEIHLVPFEKMCDILAEENIQFDWDEKDTKTPRQSWSRYRRLSLRKRREIGKKLVAPIKDNIVNSIKITLSRPEDWATRLNELEILLKTDTNEYFTKIFNSTQDAIKFLLDLQDEATDLRGRI